jgi:mRNA interferase RelE/StbE
MAFEVFWTERIKRDLNALPRDLVIRIIKKVDIAKANPYRFMGKLTGRAEWKLRIGNYRVLCNIDYENNLLNALHVEHRSKVYER